VVVATIKFPGSAGGGEATQQWICDAVVPDVKPLNVTSTCKVWAVGSITTVVKPVPVDVVGGISAAPVRLASKVIGIASAAGDCSIRAAIRNNANGRCLI
jgi:hypothetical protein